MPAFETGGLGDIQDECPARLQRSGREPDEIEDGAFLQRPSSPTAAMPPRDPGSVSSRNARGSRRSTGRPFFRQ